MAGGSLGAASGSTAPAAPDLSLAAPFVDAVFRYADPDTFVALRVFPHDRTQLPPWMVDVRVGEAGKLLREIEHGIRYSAGSTDPTVFSPAMATFARSGTAKGRDVANGLALIVELDQGDTAAALVRLEALLGPATVVVLSGGVWIDATTGEVHLKLHAYWRLSEPTRTEAEHAQLHDARQNAALLAGADPTAMAVVHCFRMPGSLNRKIPDRPVLCTIDRINPDAEVHLTDAVEILAEAASGARLNGTSDPSGGNGSGYQVRPDTKRALQAEFALIATAMACIPNEAIPDNPDEEYRQWVRWAYAIAGATGGTGFAIFRTWSAKFTAKHNDAETKTLWDRVLAAKPTKIGAGSIFAEARRHGWIDPRSKKRAKAGAGKGVTNGPTLGQAASQTPSPAEGGTGGGGDVPPPGGGPGTGANGLGGSDDEEAPEETEGEGQKDSGGTDSAPKPDETHEAKEKPDQGNADAEDGKDEGDAKPKPLTEAERDALFEHAADLDDENYEFERDHLAEQLSRGRNTKFRVTALDKLRKETRQARADAEAAKAATAAAAAAAARRGQPPPPPDDTPEVTALIAEFNAKFFVLREHGHAIIYAPKHDPVLNRRFYERIGFADLEKLYLNRSVLTGFDENTGEPIYEPVARVWLHHRNRRQFIGGMVFDPSGRKQDADVFNLWQSFGVTPHPGTWEKLKEHIRLIICNGVPEHFDYLMDWMADMVQHPAKQGEVAIVMRSKVEGTGKSLLMRTLRHICGQHGFVISNAKHLTGTFNAHQRDCIFLGADEALYAGDKAHVGIMKSIITEPFLVVEPKFRDAAQSPNYLHLMLASNETWVVPASLRSRRWLVLDVNEDRANDHPYFAAIQHELDNGGYEAMLCDLLRCDISQCNLRDVPVTAALMAQRALSLDTIEAWWLDCLTRNYVFTSQLGLEDVFHVWLNPISTELLYASYIRHCTARRERHPLNRSHFGRWMVEMAGCKPWRPAHNAKIIVGEHITDATTTGNYGSHTSRVAEPVTRTDRPPGYSLGTLTEARDAFTQATKLIVEWPDDDPNTP